MENFYENLNVETTQNIDIDYRLAGIGDRIIAQLIDFAILFVYLIFSAILYTQLLSSFIASYPLVIILTFYVPVLFYHLLCELIFKGQSFGKMARNIKVIKINGERPSILDFFIRWLSGLVEIFMTSGLLALLSILLSNKSQRIGDMLAKTTVVKKEEEITLEDTLYSEFSERYIPKYDFVKKLTDKEVDILKELIEKNHSAEYSDNLINSNFKMKDYFVNKYKIETDSKPLELFLQMLQDYNYHVGGSAKN